MQWYDKDRIDKFDPLFATQKTDNAFKSYDKDLNWFYADYKYMVELMDDQDEKSLVIIKF